MQIEPCRLYDGQPYIAEEDGKYHVLQGVLTSDDVQKWYDTKNEAVEAWNNKVREIEGLAVFPKIYYPEYACNLRRKEN